MCGLLPSPELLPQLRDLQVNLGSVHPYSRDQPAEVVQSIAARCASIAPFLGQLTSLRVDQHNGGIPYDVVFGSKVSTSLTHFSTNTCGRRVLVPLLLKYTPNLQHFSYHVNETRRASSSASWGVQEFQSVKRFPASELALLPSSTRLSILPPKSRAFIVDFEIVGRQGLDAAVTDRLAQQWQFAAPCLAYVLLHIELEIDDLQAGIEAALRQLSVLPAGSKIQLVEYTQTAWERVFPPAVAAIAAAGAQLTHLRVVPPAGPGKHAAMQLVYEQQPPLRHACFWNVCEHGGYSRQPWPWQCAHALNDHCWFHLSRIAQMPDPSNGQYEVEGSMFTLDDMHEWPKGTLARLERRLPHLTFLIRGGLQIEIRPDYDCRYPTGEIQMPHLRKALRALSACRFRRLWPQAGVDVSVKQWEFTSALTSELRTLPVFDHPATLTLEWCHWHHGCTYEHLPSIVPACYTVWKIIVSWHFTVEHLLSLCQGARARGGGANRLLLVVRVDYHVPEKFTAVQRAVVEACIDEQGLRRFVEVQWKLRL